MNQASVLESSNPATTPRRDTFAGHVLVAVSACILTVSIVGSAVFLIWKSYDRHERRQKIRAFIVSLENRSPAELDQDAQGLLARPTLAQHFVPELLDGMAHPRSERHLNAMIRVSRAFLQHQRVQRALFDIRDDRRESVAAEAVSVLSEVQPPERAAGWLARCLDAGAYAVVDEACAGLLRLGDPGNKELTARLPSLSPDRRVWLARYAAATGGDAARYWLELLRKDADPRVREAAEAQYNAVCVGGAFVSERALPNP